MPPTIYTKDYIANDILYITDESQSFTFAAQKYGIPKTTLYNRLHGQGAIADQIQPKQRLSSDDEDRIKVWALRQEQLGNELSHCQIRAAIEALLKQRGDNAPLEVNWVARFINKHPELKTKKGKIQETVRFKAFTPKAVNWYFDILETYSWIKPENIVNINKGGIIAGFGEFYLP
jgi:hypothetical protein